MAEQDNEHMAPQVENPRFEYIMVFPNGRRILKGGNAAGKIGDARWLHGLLLAGRAVGTQIESITLCDEDDKPLPEELQPDLFRAAWPKPVPVEHMKKLVAAGKKRYPGPAAPRDAINPEGVGSEGKELAPLPGSPAAAALEKGRLLLGTGVHGDEAGERDPAHRMTMAPATPLGRAVFDEVKRLSAAGRDVVEPRGPAKLDVVAPPPAPRKKPDEGGPAAGPAKE